MTWRGGAMWVAPLKPKIPLSPWNSRTLLYADHKANHFSAAIRRAATPYLEELVQGNQSGAIKGGGAEFLVFLARNLLQQAAKQNKSTTLLFGDLRKAYYSALSKLATGPMFTQEERQKILEQT